jgi:outer membrane lipoprotein-sorting protein
VKRLVLLLPLLAFVPTSTAGAAAAVAEQPTDARSLLAKMSTVSGLEARFVEKKKLALLKAPLVSEGRIYYTRGGYMARVVEKPIASTVRIGPTKLQVIDDAGKKDVDLRSRPDIKTFVESFVHVVAGDYDALAKVYKLSFASEGDDAWLLTLEPTSETLSKLVTKLEVRGKGFAPHTIRVLEAAGDSTEIALHSVDPEREFTAEERERLFGLPAK